MVSLIAVAAIVLAVQSANPRITGLYHDDGVYLATARSLAETASYRLIDVPGSPRQTKYPPIYPLLLAAAWKLAPAFPQNLPLLKSVNALLLGAVVLLTYAWLTRLHGLGPAVRVTLVLLVATAPGLFWLTDLVLSELAFVALLLVVIVSDPTDADDSPVLRFVLAGLCAGLAALTRSAGLAVCLGLIWHVWARRGWQRAMWAASGTLVVVPWAIAMLEAPPAHNELIAYYTLYEAPAWSHLTGDPGLTTRILLTNAELFMRAAPMVFGLITPLLALVSVAVMAFGALDRRVRGSMALALRLLALYALTILGHPYPMQRYLVPFVPLMYVLMGVGWTRLAGRLSMPRLTIAPLLLLLAFNVSWLLHYRSVTRTGVHAEFGRALPFEWSGFSDTAAWIRKNTPGSAVVASPYDSLYFLYTGRQAVRPWLHQPERYAVGYGLASPMPAGNRFAADLRELGVTYLVIDPLLSGRESDYGAASLRSVLEAEPDMWREAYRTPDNTHVVYVRSGQSR